MSLTRRVAHNTIIQTIGKAISTMLGILVVALMTRYLGQRGFGQYSTIIAFLQIFGILVDFGLTLITVQMISALVLWENLAGLAPADFLCLISE